ncbi:ATP-binding protein [Paenibacillus ihuae]|uniref:ATP-binding protein n=1 Tax=Paenibacillus ihuae TaxID=1232431 RepID=UPI0006D53C73|nr:ATP-binding protein [Paenibacillus ihuae]
MLHHQDHYSELLVLFSVVIALLTCFATLDLAERLVRGKRGYRFILVISCILGTGMWSMHYIGMRAMKLEVTVSYDLPLLLLSLVVSIAASYALLLLLSSPYTRSKGYLAFGGILFSSGILIMHLSGIMSMKFAGDYEQSQISVLLSIVFSLAVPVITASYNPKWIENDYNMFTAKKILLVSVLTASLTGTHYTAMSGASFPTDKALIYSSTATLLADSFLGMILACSFILIVLIVLMLLYKDRKRVLFSAKFNEQRYTALFESSPDMVLCIDPFRKKVISANPSLRHTTGYGKEELDDYKKILCTPEDEALLKAAVKQAVEGHSAKLELAVKIKSGGRLICSTTVFPLINDKQRFVYIVAEDVTAIVKFQQELIIAKEAAESADRMKSEFLAIMSHEIRTPLNGIIGINQLLAEDIENPDQQEMLRLQYRSSQALLNVISDVLDISRLESDGMQLRRETFQLSVLLQECIYLFEATAREKNLQLHLQVAGDIPEYLIGDSLRIRQIMVNLIGNAVKFTPFGEIHVTVESSDVQENGQGLTFRIKDTGIGIPPEKMELLFQPFTQLDASHSRQYQGTGLGLAISKKLIELMNGRIWVESEVDKGTEFILNIRLPSAETEPRQVQDKKEQNGRQMKPEAV